MKKIAIFVLTAILTAQAAAPAMAETAVNQPAAGTAGEAAAPGADATENDDIVIYSDEFPTNTPTGNGTVMVGTTVGIKKTGEDTIKIKAIHCARTAIAETSICDAKIIDNKASFDYAEIVYLGSGTGEIVFNDDDSITLTMNTISAGRFSFPSESVTLHVNDDVTFAEPFIAELNGEALDYGY